MPSPASAMLLNACVWALLAFGAGWWHRRTPTDQLGTDGFVLRLRKFENNGEWYERWLHVKSWKLRLPETGGHHGGMSKRTLPGRRHHDLRRFAAECRRGERTHWTIVAASPSFALWNSHGTVVAITVVNAIGNSPFIAVLRYNRARITTIIHQHRQHGAADRSEISDIRSPAAALVHETEVHRAQSARDTSIANQPLHGQVSS